MIATNKGVDLDEDVILLKLDQPMFEFQMKMYPRLMLESIEYDHL